MNIAIVSHRRPETLLGKTMGTLLSQRGIEAVPIFLFLSDEQDLEDYEDVKGVQVVRTGAASLWEKMNFIEDFFPVGEEVMVIEDDINEFQALCGEKGVKFFDLINLFEKMFDAARKSKVNLVGVYPVANAFFCKPRISLGLKFVVANCYGFISTHKDCYKVQHSEKNDYERTLRYFRQDGATLRCDFVFPKTSNYSSEEGGIKKEGRLERERTACSFIVREFEGLAKINESRKNSDYPELKLIKPK